MGRTVSLLVLGLFAGMILGVVGGQPLGAQQQPIKRTDLLKVELPDMKDTEMHVWIGDVAPNATISRHTHPTPRFVYILEGALVLEMEGKPAQTFKAGEAFVEMPDQVHSLRNASATEPAKAIGFQYAAKGRPLQTNAP